VDVGRLPQGCDTILDFPDNLWLSNRDIVEQDNSEAAWYCAFRPSFELNFTNSMRKRHEFRGLCMIGLLLSKELSGGLDERAVGA
jgi:hypothetical protein